MFARIITRVIQFLKTSNPRLGALALSGLLILGMLPVAGCNGTQVAQDIVNWMPAIQSAVAVVDSTISILAPADASVLVISNAAFDAGTGLLVTAANTYLANPNASALQQLQAQIVALQQQVNASLLAAAKIVNPTSQQKVMTDVNAVATAVNAVLALVLSISSKTQASQMAVSAKIKIAQVEPLTRPYDDSKILADHYQLSSVWKGSELMVQGQMQLQQAGF